MAKRKRDLVIHYDEEKGVVICYSTDTSNTQNIREKEFGLEVAVSVYKNAGSDEAEKMMGAGIFSLLDLHSISPIGIRDYKELSNSFVEENQEQLESAAQSGNAEAQYCLAIEWFTEGVRNGDLDQIEQAEVWLKRSADSGFPDAVTYLNEHWERDKASALRGLE